MEKVIDFVVSLHLGIIHETATLLAKAYFSGVARILIEAARGCLLQMQVDSESYRYH